MENKNKEQPTFYAISEMNAIEIYNILCKELNFNTMIELHKLILHKMTYLEDKPLNIVNLQRKVK